MATQQELEEFLRTQEPGAFVPTPAAARRRVPKTRQVSPAADVLAVEAATQLAPGAQFGGQELDVVSRHLAGGTPGPGPALVSPTVTRPATRLTPPAERSIIDVSGTAPATPSIDVAPAVDRFQGLFDQATQALTAFEEQRVPRGEERRRFSSTERVNLIRKQRQAKELLQKGTFADVGNLRLEQRKQAAAAAQNLLASAGSTRLETELLPQALAELETSGQKKQKGISDTLFDQLLQRASR